MEFTYKLDYKNYVMFLYIYLSNAGLLNHMNPFPYNIRFWLSTYFSSMFCYLKYYLPHN